MQDHNCIDCAALPESERPKKPRPTPHGGPRSKRCDEHWTAVKSARTPRRKQGPRLCRHCGKPIEGADWRLQYHPECKEPARIAAQDARRRCSKCRKTYAASRFSNDVTRADGKFPYCMSCQGEAGLAKHFQDPEAPENGNVCPVCDTRIRGHANRKFCSNKCKERAGALRTKFSLSVADYRRLLDDTGGNCPICGCRPRYWHVDHDHRTGLVTGVVCMQCNVGILAASRHELDRVKACLAYLSETPAARLGITAVAPEGAHGPSKLDRVWTYRKRAA